MTDLDSRDWNSRASTGNPPTVPSTISTTLEELVATLESSGLPGPVLLSGVPEKIGSGSQFYVFKQKVVFMERNMFNDSDVAIKRPILPENKNTSFDLADQRVQRNLRHIQNEIRALTHVRLQNHPNIVKLLSWAIEDDWVLSFVLILELAPKDLEKFLKCFQPKDHLAIRFCQDVANGMDAIHEAGFIHGDLKPANVLVFPHGMRPVAKLSDFGFAGNNEATFGTKMWQAPEKTSSVEADRFSYGLLVWSVMLLNGDPPPNITSQSARKLALADLDKKREKMDESLFGTLREALCSLLEDDVLKRPPRLSDFFLETAEPLHTDHQSNAVRYDPLEVYNFVKHRYPWEIPVTQGHLLRSLYIRFTAGSKTLEATKPAELLAMALHFTLQPPTSGEKPQSIVMRLLHISATKGNPAACALAYRMLQTTGGGYNIESVTWLQRAVSKGSIQARYDLKHLDDNEYKQALQQFQDFGGYNEAYWNTENSAKESFHADSLHSLAAFGSHEALTAYLSCHPEEDVNALSQRKESALYLACARGSWRHVSILLGKSADASISCTEFGISCLHWAIAFGDEECGHLVEALIQAGAQVNSAIHGNMEVPFPHFPFVLPAGSPLHWAAASGHRGAIRALVENGASATLRNGSDPFVYDDRIRHLYAVGGPDSEGCTFAEKDCLGLSALDIAAIHRDPFLFELLAKRPDVVDIRSADEEGFTVLHRLAHDQVFRTSRKMRYSPRWFQEVDTEASLLSIIEAVLKLGGDLERLTYNTQTVDGRRERSTTHCESNYTPLMLAVLEGDRVLVEALLKSGASVHTTNQAGTTALFHTSHRANAEQPELLHCMKALIKYGADVNHSAQNHSSVVLQAATSKLVDITDFLLSQGARADERDRTPRTNTPGKSIFAYFASVENGADQTVLRLLTRHVLTLDNREMRHRVIHGTADNRSTLLHEFAAFAMPLCCEALLEHGAEVNALARETQLVKQGEDLVRKVWWATPLDKLVAFRTFRERLNATRSTLAPAQMADLGSRWDKVLAILRASGGRCSVEEVTYEDRQVGR